MKGSERLSCWAESGGGDDDDDSFPAGIKNCISMRAYRCFTLLFNLRILSLSEYIKQNALTFSLDTNNCKTLQHNSGIGMAELHRIQSPGNKDNVFI